MTAKLAELLELQTTINQMLQEEGENATMQTKALSIIAKKTFEQACQWVNIQI